MVYSVMLQVKDIKMDKLFKQIGDEVMEYTAEDYAQREKDLIDLQKQAEEDAARQAAKEAAQAKLAALGLTADDLKALGL